MSITNNKVTTNYIITVQSTKHRVIGTMPPGRYTLKLYISKSTHVQQCIRTIHTAEHTFNTWCIQRCLTPLNTSGVKSVFSVNIKRNVVQIALKRPISASCFLNVVPMSTTSCRRVLCDRTSFWDRLKVVDIFGWCAVNQLLDDPAWIALTASYFGIRSV